MSLCFYVVAVAVTLLIEAAQRAGPLSGVHRPAPEDEGAAQPPRGGRVAPVPGGRRVTRTRRASAGVALLLALLLWLVLYPLALVLVEGLRGPEGWTLVHVREFVEAVRRILDRA